MLFDASTPIQWAGWAMVFIGLIVTNEIARRSKAGGLFMFVFLPILMTIYCVWIAIGVRNGEEWALNNLTHVYQNGWFHYAKVYAALAGCIGFMIIKYKWGPLGRAHWFRAYPFVIVAINILIAVVSDFESAAHYFTGDYTIVTAGSELEAYAAVGAPVWHTSEGVWQLCGWNNVFNGVAGLINILCMTGWWSVYASEDESDMLWPDMTWVYIVAYDVWNFVYTYNCLPTHSFFCGFALLLAPTVANALWNKGGWIQNRANTLAIWCMFAQVFPWFQELSPFVTHSVQNPAITNACGAVALVVNILAIVYVVYRARKLGVNPYTSDVFVGTRDWDQATARREDVKNDPAQVGRERVGAHAA